jgi:hypothetical protein
MVYSKCDVIGTATSENDFTDVGRKLSALLSRRID